MQAMGSQEIEHGNTPESVSLRRALKSDIDLFLDLRNLPEAVEFSESRKKVSRVNHESWFKKALDSPNARLFILQALNSIGNQKKDIGVVRFELKELSDHQAGWYVSIVLLAEHRGKGIGRKALQLSIKEWESTKPGRGNVLFARVHPNNRPSQRLFEGAGFVQTDQSSGFLTLRRHQVEDSVHEARRTSR